MFPDSSVLFRDLQFFSGIYREILRQKLLENPFREGAEKVLKKRRKRVAKKWRKSFGKTTKSY